jgi:hypothetical protein
MQGFLFDQISANARQITFWQVAQLGIQQMGHCQIQDSIAQEFKSLIVI